LASNTGFDGGAIVAFKKILARPSAVPDSPEKLLRELPRRKIADVLLHQGEVMRAYAKTCTGKPDVALQLPTGSGKTLVGLMIAEWLRRKNGDRVVYLCPTRQLVNQVVEQATGSYGLTLNGFTGRILDYDPKAKASYVNADAIAVTTYSSLFNTNPFFVDPDVIIVDDAHAAENYIVEMWSLRVVKKEREALFVALSSVLRPHMEPGNFARLAGTVENITDRAWVDKVPTPTFFNIRRDIEAVFDAHASNDRHLEYPWRLLREHLHGCHLYMLAGEILIRPVVAPTWTHRPFAHARHRIYMSATLGAGGDLERQTGRKVIERIAVPEGWDRQGVGRRFFIFPEMSLTAEHITKCRHELMRKAGRSLVLVPSDIMRNAMAEEVNTKLGFPTFSAADIALSKDPFISSGAGVALLANRYDGIDFPGDECRLVFIEGLPTATNLQERFLMSRMGANVLFNERVQTRVLQAIGRCTRSLTDYSAVVVSGEELPSYLADKRRHKYLHPELQAEIGFGVEQSKNTTGGDILDNFNTFIENGQEWEEVNQQIVAARSLAVQEPFPAIAELSATVPHEIEFQVLLWQGDYEAAIGAAERVLGGLVDPALQGYRAMWHYLSGSVAWLAAEEGVETLRPKARAQFAKAKGAAIGIPWLVALARYQPSSVSEAGPAGDLALMEQIERLEAVLVDIGTLHDRKFEQRERRILEGIASGGTFEQAQRLLGEMLGFKTGKIEEDGSPDPWWMVAGHTFVFEDYVNAKPESALDVTKARQVSSHPNWMRKNVPDSAAGEIVAVLVTPVKAMKKGAAPHLDNVGFWPVDEFRAWSTGGLATIRRLRTTFVDLCDIVWRAQAAEAFLQAGLDAPSLMRKLKGRVAAKELRELP
jgi:hypothetical protein